MKKTEGAIAMDIPDTKIRRNNNKGTDYEIFDIPAAIIIVNDHHGTPGTSFLRLPLCQPCIRKPILPIISAANRHSGEGLGFRAVCESYGA